MNDQAAREREAAEFAGLGAALLEREGGMYYRDRTGEYGPFRTVQQAFMHLLGDGDGESSRGASAPPFLLARPGGTSPFPLRVQGP